MTLTADVNETATAAVDRDRRRFLTLATTATGLLGAAVASVPFVRSMTPSARARARGANVVVDAGRLEPGQMTTIEWRGRPVWLLRRTPAMLERLARNAPLLADPESRVTSQQPDYATNLYRSINPEYLVAVGLCTHLGCIPGQRLEAGEASGLGPAWPGGYFCACHGSKFDLAGRVFRNVPAPTNLVIPPYRYVAESVIEIGAGPG